MNKTDAFFSLNNPNCQCNELLACCTSPDGLLEWPKSSWPVRDIRVLNLRSEDIFFWVETWKSWSTSWHWKVIPARFHCILGAEIGILSTAALWLKLSSMRSTVFLLESSSICARSLYSPHLLSNVLSNKVEQSGCLWGYLFCKAWNTGPSCSFPMNHERITYEISQISEHCKEKRIECLFCNWPRCC